MMIVLALRAAVTREIFDMFFLRRRIFRSLESIKFDIENVLDTIHPRVPPEIAKLRQWALAETESVVRAQQTFKTRQTKCGRVR